MRNPFKTSAIAVGVCLVALSGCKSKTARAYERVAREINPILGALKEKNTSKRLIEGYQKSSVIPLYDACLTARDKKAESYEACIARVCQSASDELLRLAALNRELCVSADDALGQLRSVRFTDVAETRLADSNLFFAEEVSSDASYLLDARLVHCGDSLGDGPYRTDVSCDWTIRCSEFCNDGWNGLARDVEQLRDDAKREGVDITSLKSP